MVAGIDRWGRGALKREGCCSVVMLKPIMTWTPLTQRHLVIHDPVYMINTGILVSEYSIYFSITLSAMSLKTEKKNVCGLLRAERYKICYVWMTERTKSSFFVTPEIRNRRQSDVCFADASLGWGCTCAVSLQLSETTAGCKHATVSCFRALQEAILDFSKFEYGLIQVFESWIWHLHAHK